MARLDLSGLERPLVSIPTEAPPKAAIAEFEEDPDNPRTEFSDAEFNELVEDIKQRGILQPLVVRRTEEGKLRVRFGARRLRAARALKLEFIPYVVTEDERQFDGYAQVSENEQRKNLEPIELARFVAKRIDGGETKTQIAKKLGVSLTQITFLLSLIDSPAFIADLYTTGKCRVAQTLYRLRKLYDTNPELVERRVAGVEEITRAFVEHVALELVPPAEKALLAPASPPAESVVPAVNRDIPPTSRQPSDGPQVEQVQAHNPLIEKTTPAARDPSRIRKPLLLGKYAGRNVMLVLSLRPTRPGLVFVRYEDDGSDDEVPCNEVAISQLTEATA